VLLWLELVCVAATLQLVVMFLHHMCSVPSFVVKTVMNFNVSVECLLSLFWFTEGKQVKFETLVVIGTFILANGTVVFCKENVPNESINLTLLYLVPRPHHHDSEQKHCWKWWLKDPTLQVHPHTVWCSVC
jgi:hypothetical protein